MKITKANKPRSRAPARAKGSADECVFPPPVAATDLPRLVLPRDEEEVRKIAEYVEWQAKGETVEHAEKVSTEHVMGRNPGGCALRGERDGCARSQKNIDFERKSP